MEEHDDEASLLRASVEDSLGYLKEIVPINNIVGGALPISDALEYTIGILIEDELRGFLIQGMRQITRDSILHAWVVANREHATVMTTEESAYIVATLLAPTRVLLHGICNYVWQTSEGVEREVGGGPINERFANVLIILRDEPARWGRSGSEYVLGFARTLIDAWRYHWTLFQTTMHTFAQLCNYMMPRDGTFSEEHANSDAMGALYSIGSQLEILDQLSLEYRSGTGKDITDNSHVGFVGNRPDILSDIDDAGQYVLRSIGDYLRAVTDEISAENEDDDAQHTLISKLMQRDKASLKPTEIAQWIRQRILQPMRQDGNPDPLNLLFAREFRGVSTMKMIRINATRHRLLPEAVARALVVSTDLDAAKWRETIQRVFQQQRNAAARILDYHAISTDLDESRYPYTIDMLEAVLVVADTVIVKDKSALVGQVAYFKKLKQYDKGLRAALSTMVDIVTDSGVDAPYLEDWVETAFMGASIASRDQVTGLLSGCNTEAQGHDRLRSLLVAESQPVVYFIARAHKRLTKRVARFADLMKSYSPRSTMSPLRERAKVIIDRCAEHSDEVARELVTAHLVWFAQLVSCTFPRTENACACAINQLATLILKAPYHLRMFLEPTSPLVISAISQAEIQGASELRYLAEVADADNKIPDSAIANPWHGWTLFPAEPIIVPPPSTASLTTRLPLLLLPTDQTRELFEWSQTAKDQIEASGVHDDANFYYKKLGWEHQNAGCFAMPTIGLLTGFTQELYLRKGNHLLPPDLLLMAYVILEPNWTVGRPLNDNYGTLSGMYSALSIATSVLATTSAMSRWTGPPLLRQIDWYTTLRFILAMSSLGPASSSLLSACNGNSLAGLADAECMRITLSIMCADTPLSMNLKDTDSADQSKINLTFATALRVLQTIPSARYENLRLDMPEYYAESHAIYVSPDAVRSQLGIFGDPAKADTVNAGAIWRSIPSTFVEDVGVEGGALE